MPGTYWFLVYVPNQLLVKFRNSNSTETDRGVCYFLKGVVVREVIRPLEAAVGLAQLHFRRRVFFTVVDTVLIFWLSPD